MYIYILTHIQSHINSYKYININIHKILNTRFFSKMLSMLHKFINILQNLL